MPTNIDYIIHTTTLKHFWGNVNKIDIPVSSNPLCLSEHYLYYVEAKLLLRFVNGIIVGHVIGENATMYYNSLGAESQISFDYLVNLMSNISKFTSDRIVSKSRKEELVCCRNIIMWHYKNLNDNNIEKYSLSEIGGLFNKDHATAIWSIEAVNREDKYKKKFQSKYKKKFIKHMKTFYLFYENM